MTKTKLKLETVTPMFLHGENRTELELRPPPFKALFRYWWRTVQDCDENSLREAEAKQDCDENSLREAEAKLFGSTKGKAPFSIRISGTTNLANTKCKPLPHRTDNRGFKRDAYKGGQSFDLHLITNTKNSSDASTYEQIAKLGFLLGGVGNRSRRGFGSIREKGWNFPSVCDLKREILDTLNAVACDTRFWINGQIIESTLTNFPGYPVIRCIHFGKPTSNVDSLLKKIGQATHDHNSDALGYAKGQKRLASPIHVRIQKVGNEYVPVVTRLHLVTRLHHSTYIRHSKQRDFICAIIT